MPHAQLRGIALKHFGGSVRKGPKGEVVDVVAALHKSRPELLPKANVVVEAQVSSDVLPSPVAINAVVTAEPKDDETLASNPAATSMPGNPPMLEGNAVVAEPGFGLVEDRVYKGTLCCQSDVLEEHYDHKKVIEILVASCTRVSGLCSGLTSISAIHN